MITIKTSYRNTVIAYNNSGVPLQRRSQEELIDLAIIGRKSGDPTILDVFTKPLPSLEQLLKLKMTKVIEKVTNGDKQNSTEDQEPKEGLSDGQN